MFWCGKQGHKASNCFNKKNGKPKTYHAVIGHQKTPGDYSGKDTKKSVNVKIVDVIDSDQSDSCFVRVFDTPEQQIKAIHKVVMGHDSGSIMYSTIINNVLFELNMDSGAGGSVLPLNYIKNIPKCPPVLPSKTKLGKLS